MPSAPQNDPPAGPAAHGLHRWRSRRLSLGLGLAIILLVAGMAACEWLEWPFLRAPIERHLATALQRDVHIGPAFGVRFLGSVRAHADDLVIGAGRGLPAITDDAGRARDIVHARNVKLALSYTTLWWQYRGDGRRVDVRLLDVDGLEVNLKRAASGSANWQIAGAAPASAPRLPAFEHLQVRDGLIRLQDEPLQIQAEARVSTREGDAPGALAPNPPASGASSRQGLSVDAHGSYRRSPLVMQFRSSGVMPLAGSTADAPAVPLWLEVRAGKSQLRIEGSGHDLLHFGGLDARFDASGPSLSSVGDALGITLPTTSAFTTQGRVRKRGTNWEADVALLDIGTSRLHGAFAYDSAASLPKLTGTLEGQRLALADLGPAFGGATPDSPKQTSPGHVLPEREFDIPSLRAMNAEVGLALETVDLGTDKLEPFQPLRAHVSLEDGVLRLQELLARTSQGSVSGTISLDSRPSLPRWDAQLRWSGIRLERFVRTRDVAARDHDPMPDTRGGYVSGALGGNATLRGTGKSTAALFASLDGSARLWVRDGAVSHLLLEAAGIDVAQALGVYLKGDDAMPMRCAVASLLVARGKVMPEVGVVDTRDTTLFVGGEVSLGPEALALKVTAQPHDFSPLALRSPIEIGGTFAAPKVRLEMAPVARKAGIAAALATLNPLAALLALVDLKQPEKDVCTTAVSHVAGAAQAGVRASAPAGAASDTGVARQAAQVDANAKSQRAHPEASGRTLTRPAAPTHP